MSQAGSSAGGGGGGAGGIDRIAGNLGAPITPILGTVRIATDNATVGFVAVAANSLSLDFANPNLILGDNAAAIVAPSIRNTGLGFAVFHSAVTASDNVAIGTAALPALTVGDNNTAIGSNSLRNLANGSDNIAVGWDSGFAYTGGEHDNILIGSPGAVGETNTIRLGNNPQTTSCWISGINGVDLGVSNVVTAAGDHIGSAVLWVSSSTVRYTNSAGRINLNFSPNPNLLLGSAGSLITTATLNVGVGFFGIVLTTGNSNSCFGTQAGSGITTGRGNTLVGQAAGEHISGGNLITAIGRTAGTVYTIGEQNNICIDNDGVIGDANVIRIGDRRDHARCFIAGINGVNLGAAIVRVVSCDANDQLGSVDLLAGAGIVLTPAAGSITLSTVAAGPGFVWQINNGDIAMAPNNGYINKDAVGGHLTLYSLPAVCAAGSVLRITGYTPGGWRITQGAGQIIHFGNLDTTVGAAGYIESTDLYDAVEIVCVTANLAFSVISCQGNITVF